MGLVGRHQACGCSKSAARPRADYRSAYQRFADCGRRPPKRCSTVARHSAGLSPCRPSPGSSSTSPPRGADRAGRKLRNFSRRCYGPPFRVRKRSISGENHHERSLRIGLKEGPSSRRAIAAAVAQPNRKRCVRPKYAFRDIATVTRRPGAPTGALESIQLRIFQPDPVPCSRAPEPTRPKAILGAPLAPPVLGSRKKKIRTGIRCQIHKQGESRRTLFGAT